jgi:hypothetical protein
MRLRHVTIRRRDVRRMHGSEHYQFEFVRCCMLCVAASGLLQYVPILLLLLLIKNVLGIKKIAQTCQ